jgi:hypothetical protein
MVRRMPMIAQKGLGEDDDPDEKRHGSNEDQHPEINADSEPPQDLMRA